MTAKRLYPTDEADPEGSLTIEAFLRLPDDDGDRMELVRGQVVREPPPGARHGGVIVELTTALHAFVGRHGLGRVLTHAGFILSEEPPTVRAPDIAFVRAERLPGRGLPSGYLPGAPDLAVEVVSPSNSPAATAEKVRDYLAAGARQVWVVDPRAREIAVHGADGEARHLGPDDLLDADEVLPGFAMRVREVLE